MTRVLPMEDMLIPLPLKKSRFKSKSLGEKPPVKIGVDSRIGNTGIATFVLSFTARSSDGRLAAKRSDATKVYTMMRTEREGRI